MIRLYVIALWWKMVRVLALAAVCLGSAGQIAAQELNEYLRRPVSERFITGNRNSWSPEHPYFQVSWDGTVPLGISLIRQLDERNGIIALGGQAEYEAVKAKFPLYAVNDLWKLSPATEPVAFQDRKELDLILTARDIDALLSSVRALGCQLLAVDRPSASVRLKASGRTFREKLLPLPELQFADIRMAPLQEISIIGYNRSFHGLSAVDYGIQGANGSNIVVGVKEQRMQEADMDIFKRVLPSVLAGGNITSHATVVASIIGGAGNSFYDGRGIAWGCRYFPSSFDNLFADDINVLNTENVSVQNHSYGTVIQQFYGAEALSYDALCRSGRSIVQVFSAGNQGTTAATTGKYASINGFANITGNFKMAKNVITVGAIDNRGQVPAESSAGPLYDGRLAPQLTALGPNGTSDAAALVSGTAAVIQQVYADSHATALPEASLVRAVLFNSADDIHNPGIDFKTGYGLLNSFAAIQSIRDNNFDGGTIAQGQQWIRPLIIPAGTARLQVTLAWTDSAAAVNNLKALINDLDLELIDNANGTVYQPWVLSLFPHRDSLNQPATRQRDSLNTAEQVSIDLPAAGTYTIRVKGISIPDASQAFHIAYRTDRLQTFRFISPQHTSDVNRDEQPVLDIRWQAFVADTNETGHLQISYNGGSTWEPLRQGLKLHTGYYAWPVKDTSSRARLRMQTVFGEFYTPEFMISRVTRLNVDFVCADSAGISWQKHVYASGYRVYAFADSAYLKPLFTVTDTFTIIRRNQYPYRVYAVEPLLNNGIPAARSIASDITLQGTGCFYRTFYYNLQDRNQLELVLEISAPAYTDSVFFEWVTANGQWLQSPGAYPAGQGFTFRHQVNKLPQGTSYWRARIRLKNGVMVYTDIISVLSSGERKILFYPNPLKKGAPLYWVVQQGVPASSGLKLYDAAGRLLFAYAELPAFIDTRVLSAGLIHYTLLGPGGQVLETGKLLLQ